MCWPYWGCAGEVPEKMGKLCEEGIQNAAWKSTRTINLNEPD